MSARPLFDIPAGWRLLEEMEIHKSGDVGQSKSSLEWAPKPAYLEGLRVLSWDLNWYFRRIESPVPRENAQRLPDGSGFFVPAPVGPVDGPEWTCVGCGNSEPAKYRTVFTGGYDAPPDCDIVCDECGGSDFEESAKDALREAIGQRDTLYGDIEELRAKSSALLSRLSSLEGALREFLAFGHPREGSKEYHKAWEKLSGFAGPSAGEG